MSKKSQKVYMCCTATKCMVYYTNVLLTPFKDTYMFDFEKQYKEALEKFEVITKQTRESYEFWYNCVMDTWKDLYSKKK